MATIVTQLGKISLTPKGEYSPDAIYSFLDIVQYEGSGYIVMAQSIKGVTPVDGDDYMLLTSRGGTGPQGPAGAAGANGAPGPSGAPGPAGADGHTPMRGTDYWTAADQAAIVNDVLAALPAAEGVNF